MLYTLELFLNPLPRSAVPKLPRRYFRVCFLLLPILLKLLVRVMGVLLNVGFPLLLENKFIIPGFLQSSAGRESGFVQNGVKLGE